MKGRNFNFCVYLWHTYCHGIRLRSRDRNFLWHDYMYLHSCTFHTCHYSRLRKIQRNTLPRIQLKYSNNYAVHVFIRISGCTSKIGINPYLKQAVKYISSKEKGCTVIYVQCMNDLSIAFAYKKRKLFIGVVLILIQVCLDKSMIVLLALLCFRAYFNASF